MTDKLILLLSKIESAASKASPLPWPKYFLRDAEGLPSSAGPAIIRQDGDAEDAQAQADQDFIVLSRSVILNLVEVAQAAANIRGTGSYRLNNALAKLEEFYL